MRDVAALAAEWGIEAIHYDAHGTQHIVAENVLRRLLAALAPASDASPRQQTPTWVWRRGHTGHSDLASGLPDAEWWLTAGGREVASGRTHGSRFELPAAVPLGVYAVSFVPEVRSERRDATLIVAPATAYQLHDTIPERIWLFAVQLYAVRSRRNWGHGDFTDLLQLVRLARHIGAAGVGLNPLHALFDDRPEQASPYSPNSRLFLNPLYIDLDAVPEFPGCQAAGLAEQIRRLRNTDLVDYRGVSTAKGQALRLAYQKFRVSPDPSRKADFEAFRMDCRNALKRFAAFETLRRRFGQVWWEWPRQWRQPSAAVIEAVQTEAAEEMGYHEFVQWLADRQLAACQTEAKRLGLPIGLYTDLAVGVEPGGADAWSEQRSIIQHVEIGAPPDLLNTAGQAWGLAAFDPRALEAEAFAPFARLLAAVMRHAGAIRLDHVLGLNRLYLIPSGCKPQEGAYIRYPLQPLLAITALESVRHRCLVVGEDLGTVPEDLRAILADWAVWSYRVMLFERRADGAFRLPHEYPRNALVTFTTHDLPTFAGWRSRHDLSAKRDVGLDPGETDDERARACALLSEALRSCGLGGGTAPEFADVMRYLARTPSRMLVIAVEDILGIADQPNIPGTVHEHPNWQRRLPLDVEDFSSHPGLRALARAVSEEGRDYRLAPGG